MEDWHTTTTDERGHVVVVRKYWGLCPLAAVVLPLLSHHAGSTVIDDSRTKDAGWGFPMLQKLNFDAQRILFPRRETGYAIQKRSLQQRQHGGPPSCSTRMSFGSHLEI